jgi:hypothetical protein
MNPSEQNIETAVRLAHYLNEHVEAIRFEELDSTVDGAALYRVDNGLGDIRHVIEGETGEMLTLDEGIDDSEALEEFRK